MKVIVDTQAEAIRFSGQLTMCTRTILESRVDPIISTAIENILCGIRDSIVVQDYRDMRLIGITQGIALACGQVCDMGQPQIAKDILGNAGMLSKQELIKNEVDDMDIEKLAGILEA